MKKVDVFNQITQELYDWLGINHPSLNVQLVKANKVIGNDYNPNSVAPPEMKLLKLSISKDGVTMPIVVCDTPDNKKISLYCCRWISQNYCNSAGQKN